MFISKQIHIYTRICMILEALIIKGRHKNLFIRKYVYINRTDHYHLPDFVNRAGIHLFLLPYYLHSLPITLTYSVYLFNWSFFYIWELKQYIIYLKSRILMSIWKHDLRITLQNRNRVRIRKKWFQAMKTIDRKKKHKAIYIIAIKNLKLIIKLTKKRTYNHSTSCFL